MPPEYSVCITNYNTQKTIRESLESLLSQLDASFEAIVCDNCSTDGSREILADYANKGKLKLIVERSTRGRGRQVAFEHSTGKWILSGFDMEDVFKPTLKDILKLYHEKHEGYMLSFDTIHIIPRAVVEEVGGWRDIYYLEDVDFRKRVEKISKWHSFPTASPLMMKKGHHPTRGQLQNIKQTYVTYQAQYRIGSPFSISADITERAWYKQPFALLIAICAIIICEMKGQGKLEYENLKPLR